MNLLTTWMGSVRLTSEDAIFVNTGLGTTITLILFAISRRLPCQQQRPDTEALRIGQFLRRSLRAFPLQKPHQALAMRTIPGPPAAILS